MPQFLLRYLERLLRQRLFQILLFSGIILLMCTARIHTMRLASVQDESRDNANNIASTFVSDTPFANVYTYSSQMLDIQNNAPFLFIENVGQFDQQIRFVVWNRQILMWVGKDDSWSTDNESRHGLRQSHSLFPAFLPHKQMVTVREFANPIPYLEPLDPVKTMVSYIIGNDSEQWLTNVPVWRGVRYSNIYPSIDLEIVGENDALVQRLVAHNGETLSQIQLWPKNIEAETTDTAVYHPTMPVLSIRHQPFSTLSVPSGNVLQTVSANNWTSDTTALVYGTYVGGSDIDEGDGIAVDLQGNLYVVGRTYSPDLSVSPGVVFDKYNDMQDAFVAKLNPRGNGVDYVTFLGGSGNDCNFSCAITVDQQGRAYITGKTESVDFPTTVGTYDRTIDGTTDVFVTRLNATGAQLDYSTFIGGNEDETGYSIVVDPTYNAFVIGQTTSNDFPVSPNAYDAEYSGERDGFVVKLNDDGTQLVYSTYLGGSGGDCYYLSCDIAVDEAGHAHVTGQTRSKDFPAALDTFDQTYNGGDDGFVAVLAPDGSRLLCGTYFGGGDNDWGDAIAIDGRGNKYVTGQTSSTDFPTTDRSFDRSYNGDKKGGELDAFVVKISPDCQRLVYGTYLGGAGKDIGYAIAVNGKGNSYVTGRTASVKFPTTVNAYDAILNGGLDAFVVELSASGAELDYATLLGGADADYAKSIAVDREGGVHVTGSTDSFDFPTTSDAFSSDNSGNRDAFAVTLSFEGDICLVTSAADSGAETLRSCLGQARQNMKIHFDTRVFSPTTPVTVVIASALPDITIDGLVIDASDAGVILDGRQLSSESDGLHINAADDVIIRGLQIVGFPDNGIEITNGATNAIIGGNRSFGDGPLGQGNLLSGNKNMGLYIKGAGTISHTIVGNLIGVDPSGSKPKANLVGVSIEQGTSHIVVGGSVPGEGNLISGNEQCGIRIAADAVQNRVFGNLIGTDVLGMSAIGNGWGGVCIWGRASQNHIGGGLPGERNVISGNGNIKDGGAGVVIDGQNTGGARANIVIGNYIGTNINGTAPIPNFHNGIEIFSGALDNIVGGISSNERNIISGNHANGVAIRGAGTVDNQIVGNYIGTAVSGTNVVPNRDGVAIWAGATKNIVGGVSPGQRNLISGNSESGVEISDPETQENLIIGNYVGTRPNGTQALKNGDYGVHLWNIAPANRIEGNLISGNGLDGIYFEKANRNTIVGNYIGTDFTGTVQLGNSRYGLYFLHGSSENRIEDNLLSGNGEYGIVLASEDSTDNVVVGNYVGSDIDGRYSVANGAGGIYIMGAAQNVIGGIAPDERNLISGNGGTGLYISDKAAISNTISNNYIGTNISGTQALPNALEGIVIDGSPGYNLIGGNTRELGNLISGNGSSGIVLGALVENNQVSHNYVGTDKDGLLEIPNAADGITMYSGGSRNIIINNLVSGNRQQGIVIGGNGTDNNWVSRNIIGADASGVQPLGNSRNGIYIWSGASNSLIGPENIIAFNNLSGVVVDGDQAPTSGHTITQNGIFSNRGKGIELINNGNAAIRSPVISATWSTLVYGTAEPNSKIEVFSDDADEGRYFEGSTIADGRGNWTLCLQDKHSLTGPFATATTTGSSGSTSEFSAPVQITDSPPPRNCIRVVNDEKEPIQSAWLYHNGKKLTETTNADGVLNYDPETQYEDDDILLGLIPIISVPTQRDVHDEWAFQVYLTSLNLDNDGQPLTQTIGEIGNNPIIIHRNNPLILFNIVVSIEWDADAEYLAMLEDAFRKASDYLYDVTDGQMTFGQVSLYDNAQYWSHADFQISTKNTVHPYAYVGGITSDDTAHTIRVGRFWNGNSGNEGNWNEPNGYRTLIHEFGHYGLYLYDEYFMRTTDANDRFTGRQAAACTGLDVGPSDPPDPSPEKPENASIMYYQYKASELADGDRWGINCQTTEQHRIHQQSDWQTVLQYYGSPDWKLNTPTNRGSVMEGPSEFPRGLLPFPEITIHDGGYDNISSREVTVVDPQGQPVSNALIALFTAAGEQTIAIDQGLTNAVGRITVYGANKDDRIQAASFDGSLAGAITVGVESTVNLPLASIGSLASAADSSGVPYLGITPSSEGTGLFIQVNDLAQSPLPLIVFLIPAEGGGTPQFTVLTPSPTDGIYSATISLDGIGLGTGSVQINGGSLPVTLHSDYNLQRILYSQPNSLYSEDGNFAFHLPPEALSGGADGYATVLPTGYVPGLIPANKRVIGNAYEVRLSSANTLTKDALVELTHHPEVMGSYQNIAIYRWDTAARVWRSMTRTLAEASNLVHATGINVGIYVLMGELAEQPSQIHEIYLPLLRR